MFERFTKTTINIIAFARQESGQFGHSFVGTEQILLGLLRENTSLAAKALQSSKINLDDARLGVENIKGRSHVFCPLDISFTPRATTVLTLARDQANLLGNKYVAPEHLLLALLTEGESVAMRTLQTLKVNTKVLRRRLLILLGVIGSKDSQAAHRLTRKEHLNSFELAMQTESCRINRGQAFPQLGQGGAPGHPIGRDGQADRRRTLREWFAEPTIQVIAKANARARENGSAVFTPDDLLTELLRVADPLPSPVMDCPQKYQERAEKFRVAASTMATTTVSDIAISQDVLGILMYSREEAVQREAESVAPEHLLLGLSKAVASGSVTCVPSNIETAEKLFPHIKTASHQNPGRP